MSRIFLCAVFPHASRRPHMQRLRRRGIASGVYVRTIEYQTNGNGMVVGAINAVVFAISLKTFFRVKICAIRRGVGAPNRPLRPVFQRKLENHCWGNLHMFKKIQSPIDCKISTFRLFHIKGCWLNFFAMRSLLLF